MLHILLSIIHSTLQVHAASPLPVDPASTGVIQVAGAMQKYTIMSGGFAVNDLAEFAMRQAWMLVGIVALYNVVRAGIRMINSEEEDKLSKARRTIVTSIAAVAGVFLVPRLVIAIYTGNTAGGFTCPTTTTWGGAVGIFGCVNTGVTAGAAVFGEEIQGVIGWVQALVAPIAIAMLVVTGIQAIASFGKDDAQEKMRRAVFAVAGGIMILIVEQSIKLALGLPATGTGLPGTPSTGPIINRAIVIVNKFTLYLALVGVFVIIATGILYITSRGNEDQASKARELLVRVIIGTAVIFVSYALISVVTGFFT